MKPGFFSLFLLFPLLFGCGQQSHTGEGEEHHDHHGEEKDVVHLSEESQRMIELELTTVRKEKLISSIELAGQLAQETENVTHVTSPGPGILKTFLKQTGEVVEKGTPLCIVQTKTGEEIQIPSVSHGIILAQYVREKDSVDSLTSILTIADPDKLRASFNVYEKDLAGIRLGQEVLVETIAYPGRQFKGPIVFISPAVDEKTRTIKIRADVGNEEHLLKFGMFVTGKIFVPISDEVLVIPPEAVQEIKGTQVVFMPQPGEKSEFLVKQVLLGRKTEKQIEVLNGLSEGGSIVGKGSFYLKSELLKGELEEGHAH